MSCASVELGQDPDADVATRELCISTNAHGMQPAGQWILFQRLGAEFESVVSSGASYHAQQIFCSPCREPSADGITFPVPFLRGASGLTWFEHQGLDYLAVAQSFDVDCADEQNGIVSGRCENMVAQPRSTVLQLNAETQRFGELLALPSSDFVSEARAKTEQALRIDAGRASRFVFMQAEGQSWLVACSRSHGALVYSWQFHQTDVLQHVVSVMFAPNAPNSASGARMHILAASRGTNAGISSRMQASRGGALAVLELAAQFDDLGKQPPSCAVTSAGAPQCLRVVQELVEHHPTGPGVEQECANHAASGRVCLEHHGLAMAGRIRMPQMMPHDRACTGSHVCLVQVNLEICHQLSPYVSLSFSDCMLCIRFPVTSCEVSFHALPCPCRLLRQQQFMCTTPTWSNGR